MAAEAINQRGICRRLTERGHWWTKVHQTGRGRRGIPDLIACVNGYFLAIEVKGPRGKASDSQVHELTMVRRAGGVAIVAETWDEVLRWVEILEDQDPPHIVTPQPDLAAPRGTVML